MKKSVNGTSVYLSLKYTPHVITKLNVIGCYMTIEYKLLDTEFSKIVKNLVSDDIILQIKPRVI